MWGWIKKAAKSVASVVTAPVKFVAEVVAEPLIEKVGEGLAAVGKGIAKVTATVVDKVGLGKDGILTQFVQNWVPGGGFVTAAFHAASGHEDYAQYAAVKGLSTSVNAGISAVGALGGPAGMVLAGGLGSLSENLIEGGMKGLLKPSVKDKLDDLSWEGAVTSMGIGAAGGALGGGGKKGIGKLFGRLSRGPAKAGFRGTVQRGLKKGSTKLLRPSASAGMKKLDRYSSKIVEKAWKKPAIGAVAELEPTESFAKTEGASLGKRWGLAATVGGLALTTGLAAPLLFGGDDSTAQIPPPGTPASTDTSTATSNSSTGSVTSASGSPGVSAPASGEADSSTPAGTTSDSTGVQAATDDEVIAAATKALDELEPPPGLMVDPLGRAPADDSDGMMDLQKLAAQKFEEQTEELRRQEEEDQARFDEETERLRREEEEGAEFYADEAEDEREPFLFDGDYGSTDPDEGLLPALVVDGHLDDYPDEGVLPPLGVDDDRSGAAPDGDAEPPPPTADYDYEAMTARYRGSGYIDDRDEATFLYLQIGSDGPGLYRIRARDTARFYDVVVDRAGATTGTLKGCETTDCGCNIDDTPDQLWLRCADDTLTFMFDRDEPTPPEAERLEPKERLR
jgi:hypothetical protein